MDGFLSIRLVLGNDAMNSPKDVAKALRDLADRIDWNNSLEVSVRDANGNKVGYSQFTKMKDV